MIPILVECGWNIGNPEEVSFEEEIWNNSGYFVGRCDCILRKDGVAVVIEVKKLGTSVNGYRKQLKRYRKYCRNKRTSIGIITDGETWIIIRGRKIKEEIEISIWDDEFFDFLEALKKRRIKYKMDMLF
ncbi:MAG: hypothetical protein ABIL47_07670 [candidate division WOR-3 bacterium]